MLRRLSDHGVQLKKEKCRFMEDTVEYLGHLIDANGLHATDSKLKAIRDAPQPKNVQELRAFLGLLNYYGRFIPNRATLTKPLTRLLYKDTPWRWTQECMESFQKVKDVLVSSNCVTHYNPSFPLRLAADASAYGLGAVLSHVMEDGQEQPIAFASRSLSKSEQNYAQVEKEALALIFGVKKFHLYLWGRTFTLVTDHKPLTSILGPKQGTPPLAAARLQRWSLILAAYDYKIEYRSTDAHGNADSLSRLPLQSKVDDSVQEEPSIFNVSQIQSLPVTSTQVCEATRTDIILSKVLRYVKSGWPQQVSRVLQPYFARRFELSVEGGCLLWGIRVIIPKKLQGRTIEELHKDHQGIARMKSLARSYFWWPGLDKVIENEAKSCVSCQAVKQGPPVAPLQPWSWPDHPWSRVHLDFAGPFRGHMFLVAVDAHSKWPEVFIMKETTAAKTIESLRDMFSRYGFPETIVTDNGPQFVSQDFADFLKLNGVRHIRSTPYHPASNGLAERFVQSFKTSLKAVERNGLPIRHQLANVLLAYRSTPHSTTGVSPASLFFKRQLRTRLDMIHPDISSKVQNSQTRQKEYHDRRARFREFSVGQSIMARNMRPGPDWVQAEIIERLGPLTYMVKTKDQLLWRRHIDLLRELSPRQAPELDEFAPEPDSHWSTPPVDNPTVPQDPPPVQEPRYPSRNRRPPNRYGWDL